KGKMGNKGGRGGLPKGVRRTKKENPSHSKSTLMAEASRTDVPNTASCPPASLKEITRRAARTISASARGARNWTRTNRSEKTPNPAISTYSEAALHDWPRGTARTV